MAHMAHLCHCGMPGLLGLWYGTAHTTGPGGVCPTMRHMGSMVEKVQGGCRVAIGIADVMGAFARI